MVCVNTTSPLQMAAEECKVLRCAVENGVPIDVEPMTVAGASTPFTLAGTLMVENAEVLYMLCLANVIRPGAKVMASTVGAILNMKTPNLSLAAPEAMLMASAEAAMTRLHNIPVMRMGGYCDAYYLDVQAGIEKAVFTLIVALSGADLVLMGGPLNNAAHQSCELVVIDHDVWEMVERLTREIQVDDETLAYETVAQVGIGGSQLETAIPLNGCAAASIIMVVHITVPVGERRNIPCWHAPMAVGSHPQQAIHLCRAGESLSSVFVRCLRTSPELGVEPPEWPTNNIWIAWNRSHLPIRENCEADRSGGRAGGRRDIRIYFADGRVCRFGAQPKLKTRSTYLF